MWQGEVGVFYEADRLEHDAGLKLAIEVAPSSCSARVPQGILEVSHRVEVGGPGRGPCPRRATSHFEDEVSINMTFPQGGEGISGVAAG